MGSLEINSNNNINKILIISFGGCQSRLDGIPPFEFLKSLDKWFPNIDKKFYIDLEFCWYHKGIKGISLNIPDTTEYLKNKISDYKKIIFLGASAGGYAAILFGSLLKVTNVIAFKPQTILTDAQAIDKAYKNLRTMINSEVKYLIYGDLEARDELHHISHVDNLNDFLNIKIINKNRIDLPTMRNNGELFNIINSIIEY